MGCVQLRQTDGHSVVGEMIKHCGQNAACLKTNEPDQSSGEECDDRLLQEPMCCTKEKAAQKDCRPAVAGLADAVHDESTKRKFFANCGKQSK